MKELLSKVFEIEEEIIAIRRDLHMHPELAFQEHRTAGLAADGLRQLGLDVQTGVAKTGVVGLLKGSRPGRTIAIRADMDAIEGNEVIDKPYVSKVQGVQHGCGHDVLVAMALGAAKVLSEMRDKLSGNVKFIFEPAEEVLTEDDLTTGTQLMLEAGVVDHVDALLYLHVWPWLESGKIELHRGMVFSGWDMLSINILGRENHGGTPEKGVDAITVAAQVVSGLQTMLTRAVSITEPCSINIGSIKGGRACNMVADRVEMKGSVRCTNLELRKKLPEQIEQLVRNITSAYGATYEMKYSDYLHPIVNSPELVELVAGSVASATGPDKVCWGEHPWMIGDSFYRYCERVPCCYGLLGSGNKELKTDYQLHHPLFDIDESCMQLGVITLCASVLRFLEGNVDVH